MASQLEKDKRLVLAAIKRKRKIQMSTYRKNVTVKAHCYVSNSIWFIELIRTKTFRCVDLHQLGNWTIHADCPSLPPPGR